MTTERQFHPGAMAAGDQIIAAMKLTAADIIGGAMPEDDATQERLVAALESTLGPLACVCASLAVSAMGHMYVATIRHVNDLMDAASS